MSGENLRVIDIRMIGPSSSDVVNKKSQIYRSVNVEDFDSESKYANDREMCSYREYVMTSLSEYSSTTKYTFLYRLCASGIARCFRYDYFEGADEFLLFFLLEEMYSSYALQQLLARVEVPNNLLRHVHISSDGINSPSRRVS